jgi:hypothetical protein
MLRSESQIQRDQWLTGLNNASSRLITHQLESLPKPRKRKSVTRPRHVDIYASSIPFMYLPFTPSQLQVNHLFTTCWSSKIMVRYQPADTNDVNDITNGSGFLCVVRNHVLEMELDTVDETNWYRAVKNRQPGWENGLGLAIPITCITHVGLEGAATAGYGWVHSDQHHHQRIIHIHYRRGSGNGGGHGNSSDAVKCHKCKPSATEDIAASGNFSSIGALDDSKCLMLVPPSGPYGEAFIGGLHHLMARLRGDRLLREYRDAQAQKKRAKRRKDRTKRKLAGKKKKSANQSITLTPETKSTSLSSASSTTSPDATSNDGNDNEDGGNHDDCECGDHEHDDGIDDDDNGDVNNEDDEHEHDTKSVAPDAIVKRMVTEEVKQAAPISAVLPLVSSVAAPIEVVEMPKSEPEVKNRSTPEPQPTLPAVSISPTPSSTAPVTLASPTTSTTTLVSSGTSVKVTTIKLPTSNSAVTIEPRLVEPSNSKNKPSSIPPQPLVATISVLTPTSGAVPTQPTPSTSGTPASMPATIIEQPKLSRRQKAAAKARALAEAAILANGGELPIEFTTISIPSKPGSSLPPIPTSAAAAAALAAGWQVVGRDKRGNNRIAPISIHSPPISNSAAAAMIKSAALRLQPQQQATATLNINNRTNNTRHIVATTSSTTPPTKAMPRPYVDVAAAAVSSPPQQASQRPQQPLTVRSASLMPPPMPAALTAAVPSIAMINAMANESRAKMAQHCDQHGGHHSHDNGYDCEQDSHHRHRHNHNHNNHGHQHMDQPINHHLNAANYHQYGHQSYQHPAMLMPPPHLQKGSHVHVTHPPQQIAHVHTHSHPPYQLQQIPSRTDHGSPPPGFVPPPSYLSAAAPSFIPSSAPSSVVPPSTTRSSSSSSSPPASSSSSSSVWRIPNTNTPPPMSPLLPNVDAFPPLAPSTESLSLTSTSLSTMNRGWAPATPGSLSSQLRPYLPSSLLDSPVIKPPRSSAVPPHFSLQSGTNIHEDDEDLPALLDDKASDPDMCPMLIHDDENKNIALDHEDIPQLSDTNSTTIDTEMEHQHCDCWTSLFASPSFVPLLAQHHHDHHHHHSHSNNNTNNKSMVQHMSHDHSGCAPCSLFASQIHTHASSHLSTNSDDDHDDDGVNDDDYDGGEAASVVPSGVAQSASISTLTNVSTLLQQLEAQWTAMQGMVNTNGNGNSGSPQQAMLSTWVDGAFRQLRNAINP